MFQENFGSDIFPRSVTDLMQAHGETWPIARCHVTMVTTAIILNSCLGPDLKTGKVGLVNNEGNAFY